jgi:hypothetical protein
MTIREHDLVVLTADIPGENFQQGDVGTVVLVHGAGLASNLRQLSRVQPEAAALRAFVDLYRDRA